MNGSGHNNEGVLMSFRFSVVSALAGLLFLVSCATVPAPPVVNHHVLLDNKSTRFFVRTIPIPRNPGELKIVRRAELNTSHHISFPEFLRQVEPHHLPGHFYLMDYSRSVEEAPDSSVTGDWIRPIFGNPYRYHYQGTVVVLRDEWEKMKADEQKKVLDRARKVERQRRSEGQLMGGEKGAGPDGGRILQEDAHALTEMLPSGAYIVHPASELKRRGYLFVSGHWQKIHSVVNQ
ncbi:MAG: hypothetical protein ACYC9S_03515 [Leptospirales bacterium]